MNIDRHIATLLSGECLPERDLKLICDRAKEIFLKESNIQPFRAPVNVCGNIHGQLYNLQALMKEGGDIPSSNYIFLGDFVDKGYNLAETLQYLLCLKGNLIDNFQQNILEIFFYSDEIMNPLNVLSCMVFMKNYFVNKVVLIHGDYLWKCLIVYHQEHQLNVKYFVFMADYLQTDMRIIDQMRAINRKYLINHLNFSHYRLKFLIRVHFVIQCGQILKKLNFGNSIPEELVSSSEQKQQKSFADLMISP